MFYGAMPVRRLGSIGFDTEDSCGWPVWTDWCLDDYSARPVSTGVQSAHGDARDPLTNVGFNLDSTVRSNPVGYTQQWSLSV